MPLYQTRAGFLDNFTSYTNFCKEKWGGKHPYKSSGVSQDLHLTKACGSHTRVHNRGEMFLHAACMCQLAGGAEVWIVPLAEIFTSLLWPGGTFIWNQQGRDQVKTLCLCRNSSYFFITCCRVWRKYTREASSSLKPHFLLFALFLGTPEWFHAVTEFYQCVKFQFRFNCLIIDNRLEAWIKVQWNLPVWVFSWQLGKDTVISVKSRALWMILNFPLEQ